MGMKFQATDIIKKKLIVTGLTALLCSSCAGDERHSAGVAALSGGVGMPRLLDKNLPPAKLTNLSWGLPRDTFDKFPEDSAKDIRELMAKRLGLNNKHAIVVHSAGNSLPYMRQKFFKPLSGLAIKVGSVDHQGVGSAFSHSSKDVVVLAPSNYWSIPAFGGRKIRKIGGTSASAPLVTAALADVVSLLPALEGSGAEHLLRKTAIKTSTNLVSEMNGVGVVNHYKMVRVAQRLADKSYLYNKLLLTRSQLNDLLTLRDLQNKHLLTSERIYDFRAEVKELLTTAKQTSDPEVKLKKITAGFFLRCRQYRYQNVAS